MADLDFSTKFERRAEGHRQIYCSKFHKDLKIGYNVHQMEHRKLELEA
jgi:hypothetical protein